MDSQMRDWFECFYHLILWHQEGNMARTTAEKNPILHTATPKPSNRRLHDVKRKKSIFSKKQHQL